MSKAAPSPWPANETSSQHRARRMSRVTCPPLCQIGWFNALLSANCVAIYCSWGLNRLRILATTDRYQVDGEMPAIAIARTAIRDRG